MTLQRIHIPKVRINPALKVATLPLLAFIGVGGTSTAIQEASSRISPPQEHIIEVEKIVSHEKFAHYQDSIANANKGKLFKAIKTDCAWRNIAKKVKSNAISTAKHTRLK